MNHKDRLQLAKNLSEKILSKYGDKVLLVGLLGSTYRGNDVEHSDLEMICVLSGDEEGRDASYFYNGIYGHVWIDSDKAIQKSLNQTPSKDWPLEIGTFYFVEPLHEKDGYLAKLQKEISNIPEDKFSLAVREHLPITVGELNEIKQLQDRNISSQGELFWAVNSFVYHATMLIALVNKKPLCKSGLKMVSLLDDKEQPAGYYEKVEVLYSMEQLDKAIDQAEKIMSDVLTYLKSRGVEFKEAKSLDEIII